MPYNDVFRLIVRHESRDKVGNILLGTYPKYIKVKKSLLVMQSRIKSGNLKRVAQKYFYAFLLHR